MSQTVPGLVSVIVPIYNVEPFLRDCLDSLRAQTHRDLQVILVDDGSTDRCAQIAEEYVGADPRFQLIRQANAGLSAARNNGLTAADGEFLAFVDSDDVLAAHAYELLVDALRDGADFASGGVLRLSSRGTYKGAPHKEALAATDLEAHVSRNHVLLRDRTIWNKLFRRDFYDEHGFEFPVGRLFEDVPVTVPAHAVAAKVAIVAEPIYFWRIREGAVRSITQSDNNLRNVVDRFYTTELTRELLAKAGQDALRRVYEEQAIWDKLSGYLTFLPAATPQFRETFLDLATKYLSRLDPGAVERQPDSVRKQWELIRDGRVDELLEVIDHGFRPATQPAPKPALDCIVQDVAWVDGKLRVSGTVRMAGGKSGLGALRMFWLGAVGGRRKVPLWSRGGKRFVLTVDPAAMRQGKKYANGSWNFGVAAARGLQLGRSRLHLPEDSAEVLPRREIEPGVWIIPQRAKGQLRLRVSRAAGWLTESRREGDDLVLTGRLRSKASGTARIELSRAKGLVSHAIEAEVKAGVFTARVPLARIALDVNDDNHASGLYADHFLVDLAIGGKEPSRLVAGDAYVTTRAAFGTDEVYTAVNDSGQVSIRTRPLGPVVTSASWNAAGALELAGDSAVDVDGELLLRLRGRRKDLAIGLRVTGGRWAVTVDPAAVPGPAGSLPMTAGVWDLAFRSAGRRHTTIASLGVVSETRMTLPLRGDGADGTVGMLRRATDERATLTIEPPAVRPVTKPAPAELRSAPLREAVLFDAAPGRRFADDPAAMVAELGSRPGAPVALWAHERGQAVPEGAEPVLLGSPAWQSALATSRWIVTNDDLPRWFEPRPEQVVLRLGGGWPVARAGALATAHPLGDQLIEQVTGDARKWTALASPGRSATPVLREEFRYTGEVLEYGRPGGDLLQTMAADEAHAAVLAWLGLPAGTRLVLYAPTRRPMDLRKRGWSDPGRLLNLLNVVEELPEGYRLLVRRHPAVDEDVLGLPDGAIEVSAYPRASELLLAADVLITDYSALLADYASTGRPVLLHVPDLDEFAASPGLNVDFADHAPGPLLGSSEEVVAALRDIDVVAADHEGAAKAFAVSHPVDGGGRAAANLVDWLLAARR